MAVKHIGHRFVLALFVVFAGGNFAAADDNMIATEARILDSTYLFYPYYDRRFSHEDTVVVRVNLDAAGKPLSAEVTQGSEWEGLNRAAVENVLHWKFSPAKTADGNGIMSGKLVKVVFRFRSDEEESGDAEISVGDVANVLGAYYVFRKTTMEYLHACATQGFDTKNLKARFLILDRRNERKVEHIEAQFAERDPWRLVRTQAVYKDGSGYGDHIRIQELRDKNSPKARERCTRIVASLENDGETFENFDPVSYELFSRIPQ